MGSRNNIIKDTNFIQKADETRTILIIPKSKEKGWVIDEELDTNDISFSKSILEYVKQRENAHNLKNTTSGISLGAVFSIHLANQLSGISKILSIGGNEKKTDKYKNIKENKSLIQSLLILGNQDKIVPYPGGESDLNNTYKFYSAQETLIRLAFKNGIKYNDNKIIFENDKIKIEEISKNQNKSDSSILITIKGFDYYDLFQNKDQIILDVYIESTNQNIQLSIEGLSNLFLDKPNIFYEIINTLEKLSNK